MKVLVIGSGGREHTISWKLAQSEMVEKVFCAPGNAGIALDIECIDIGVSELDKLADFAENNKIGLTVVGPEVPLCAGIVDIFNERGLKVFGPGKAGAELEGSKSFAKDFMNKHGIPTARSEVFTTEQPAIDYVNVEFDNGEKGIVIKADGLAAGKGVFVALCREDAVAGINECFSGSFGESGYRVLIEECLFGEEASILALTDGKTITALASSQDHKRLLDGDGGPNTGGMGAYSPAPVVDEALMAQVDELVLKPFLRGIQQDDLYFRGIIYAGVMVTDKGIKILEFNVRFGDPETQAVLYRLESDLADAMLKTAEGRLDEVELKWSEDTALCVVMASGGYPAAYEKGHEITGIDAADATEAKVFHAGTADKNGKIVNTGGRVLGVTAKGSDIVTARENAYAAVEKISWTDAFYRKDIAYRALDRS